MHGRYRQTELSKGAGVWGLARSERLCLACNCGAVEDEEHVLIHCSAYASARAAVNLPYDQGILAVMAVDDQASLAGLLFRISETRAELLPHGR